MGRKIDLTGKTFGKLTVIKEYPDRTPQGSIQWECQCECGNITIVSGDNLRRNHTVSCGCQKKESAQKRVIDLTGQKFGKLTVIAKANPPIKTSNHTYWWCNCDCGTTNLVIDGENLKRGSTKTCGCEHSSKPRDIVGQKFGKLTAINYFHKDDRVIWNCQCECGNMTTATYTDLTKGRKQSCGCIKYSIGEYNISEILKQNNIEYISEYKYPDLGLYRYDFYLPQYNRLIEFDGRQHFFELSGSWYDNDNLQQRQTRDKIKNEWALKNNIPLVRIPYWERDNITLEMIIGDQYLVKGVYNE